MRQTVNSGQSPVVSIHQGGALVELSPLDVFRLAAWAESLKRRILPAPANRKKPLALNRKHLDMSRFQRLLATSVERVK